MGYRRADYGWLFHVATREMWALCVFRRAWIYLSVHKSEKGRGKSVTYVREYIRHLWLTHQADTFDFVGTRSCVLRGR